MAKKSDILGDDCSGWESLADCRDCVDYDTCDCCGRRTCKWVAVTIFENGESSELFCRPCCEKQGWNEDEIASQAIDVETGLSGERITRPDGSERD